MKQYDNMEQPPPGSIWRRSTKDAKHTTVSQQVSAATTGAMNDAFTSMVSSIASTLGHSSKISLAASPSPPSWPVMSARAEGGEGLANFAVD